MKEYPEYARPRERMEMLGAEQLSDQELLAILLATGSKEYSALDLAERLLQSHKGLPGLRELSLDELMEQKGIGAAKATTIAAAIELGKRICYSSCDYRPVIASPSGAAATAAGANALSGQGTFSGHAVKPEKSGAQHRNHINRNTEQFAGTSAGGI